MSVVAHINRNEHSAGGGGGPPLRPACPGPVAHHQHGGDRVRQQAEGQPRRGAGDHPHAQQGPAKACHKNRSQDRVGIPEGVKTGRFGCTVRNQQCLKLQLILCEF